jgi:hypothetical protein
MDITFTCKCGQEIVIDEAGAGITIDCPGCGKPVYVPSKEADRAKDTPIRVKTPLAKLVTKQSQVPPPPSQPARTPVTPAGHNLALSGGESVTVQGRMHPIVVFLPVISMAGAFVAIYLMFSIIALPLRIVIGTHIGSVVFLTMLAPLLLLTIVSTVLAAVSRANTLVTLTSRRLIINKGVLSKTTAELLLKQIETVALHLPLLGRIFGYGTIVVRGTGGGVFQVQYMEGPEHLYRILQSCLQSAKP